MKSKRNRRHGRKSWVGSLEHLEPKMLLTSQWQNPDNPFNVDGDEQGIVGFDDAKAVVAELEQRQLSSPETGSLLREEREPSEPFVDVDGDGFVSPVDLVLVLNHFGGPEPDCFFDGQDPAWRVSEIGGAAQPGTIVSTECAAVIHEGDSLATTLYRQFTVTPATGSVAVEFASPEFDSSADFHQDAFEIAVVDDRGNPLVANFAGGRDAAFNVSERAAAELSAAASLTDGVVTIGLEEIPEGTEATLVLRLVNNDNDIGTSVTITDVQFQEEASPAGLPTGILGHLTAIASAQRPAAFSNRADAGFADAISRATGHEPGLSISAVAARGVASSGAILLISGRVERTEPNIAGNEISHVTANGLPVEVLDASGNFFTKVVVHEGENAVELIGVTSDSQTVQTRLNILGDAVGEGELNVTALEDVTASLDVQYGVTSFYAETATLFADVSVQNAAQRRIGVPVVIAFSNFSGPDIVPLNPAVRSNGGVYYYQLATGDTELEPGEATATQAIGFYNPGGEPFTYEVTLLGRTNQPPQIESLPVVEAVIGQNYAYDVEANDPDGDTIQFRLMQGPTGASIDESGSIRWQPGADDRGTHAVTVEASDSNGGASEQSFTVAVIDPPPNRPPIITSLPDTVARVSGDRSAARPTIPAIIRDFSDAHTDFQEPCCGLTTGIVEAELGEDGTPVLIGDQTIESPESFFQWYHDVPGVNLRLDTQLPLVESEPGSRVFEFRDVEFFPIDGGLLGNEGRNHNFHFTLQSHSEFVYRGNETLTFTGDDDVWVFVDGRLAVDLGGKHIPATGSVELDTLGLTAGESYPLDIFFAERLTVGSSFQLSTTIDLAVPTYSYSLAAFDPDNDVLKYSLVEHPEGMTIDPDTGLVLWAPLESQLGDHAVTLRISDGRGGQVEQHFIVCVHADESNHRPVISGQPRTEFVRVGEPYEYEVRVTDGDGDAVELALGEAPEGVTLDAESLLVSWPDAEPGRYPITIIADDGRGGRDLQSFDLTVRDPLPGTGVIKGFAFEGSESIGPVFELPAAEVSGTTADRQDRFVLPVDLTPEHRLVATVSGTVEFDVTNRVGFSADWNAAGVVVRSRGDRTEVGGTDQQLLDDGLIRLAIGNPQIGFFPLFEPNAETGLGSESPPEVLSLRQTAREIFGEDFAGLPAGTALFYRVFDTNPGDNSGSFSVAPFENQDGIAGWTIYLDADNDGTLDDGELAAVTRADGSYAFTDLPPGEYIVREQTATGWDQLFPVEQTFQQVTVAADVVQQRIDFANQKNGAANTPPAISDVNVIFAEIGQPLIYDVPASDANNDAVAIELILAPAGMVAHPISGTVTWVPLESQRGEHSVLVRATDGLGGQSIEAFTVTVGSANTPPIFTSTPPIRSPAGAAFEYRLSAQDAESNAIAFRLSEAPDGMTIETSDVVDVAGTVIGENSVIRWTSPADAVSTEVPVTVIATDGDGGEVTQSFLISVIGAAADNAAPRITSTPNRHAIIGVPYRYAVNASDTEGNELRFELTSAPAGLGISEQGVLSWDAPVRGVWPVALTVQDGRGGEDSQSFELSVGSSIPAMQPSIVSEPPAQATLGAIFAYNPAVAGRHDSTLRWRLTDAPHGMSIDVQSGTIRWIPEQRQLGRHPVTVSATNGSLATASQSFVVEVGCSNLGPLITSVPPTIAHESATYRYAVRAEDVEMDPLTWRLAEAPNSMAISEEGVIRWRPDQNDLGPHEVVVEVDDGSNVARQSYVIVVRAAGGAGGSAPPVIHSTPVEAAATNQPYEYVVQAFDQDGEEVTYALAGNAPQAMSVSDAGVVSWLPTDADAGERIVTIIVTDAGGATATQSYRLVVTANRAPTIDSTPPVNYTPGAMYRYGLDVTDADGDDIRYTLVAGPDGMRVDAFGQVFWNPAPTDTQQASVEVLVSDGRGGTASQIWNIAPTADATAPSVSMTILTAFETFTASEVHLNPGNSYTIWVRGSDNVAIDELMLLADGQEIPLDREGLATLTADELGKIKLLAFAIDSAGNVGMASTLIVVRDAAEDNRPMPDDPTLPEHPGFDPADTQRPTVVITSPALGDSVTNAVPIIGTVDDPEDNLWYYRVFVGRSDQVSITDIDLQDPDWLLIEERTEEVIDGELAVFDPSNLENSAYAILLAGFDVNGEGFAYPTTVFVEGNVRLDNFRLEFTDLVVPLSGIPIEINRVYDTLDSKEEGDFGFGWTLGIQDADIFEAVALGVGGALNFSQDKFVPDRTKVYLTNPDGERIGFTYREEIVAQSFFGAELRAYFEPDPGVYDRLTIENDTTFRGGAFGPLVAGLNPDRYTLTRPDGTKYLYDQFAGLQSITNRQGNIVTFTPNGVTHSSGEAIQFRRDNRGRIVEIIDPAGNSLFYRYDTAGDLREFTDQANVTTSYHYRDMPAHFLDDVIDGNGNRALKAVYEQDEQTRQWEFKGVVDVFGNRVDERSFEAEQNSGVIRDGNGNPTTLIFDDRGNVLDEIDPLGNTIFREYTDAANPDAETRIIDRRGFVTEQTFDARGNVTEIRDLGHVDAPLAEPIVTRFTYNADNDVTSVTDGRGNTTIFRYEDGLLTEIENARGDIASFTYFAGGDVESFTDFRGNTTEFSDYENGQPRRIVFADGTEQRLEYNQFGQTTYEAFFEADGTLAVQRRSEFDAAGRLIREIAGSDADGSTTERRLFYDGNLLDWEIIVHPDSLNAQGNLTESPATPIADRHSSITDYEYDAAARLIRQIDAEGGEIDFRYDAQGNRIALRDPVGNITTWLYDPLNRPTEERDPLYWEGIRTSNPDLEALSADAFFELVAPVLPDSNSNPLYDDASGASCEGGTGAAHVILTCYDAEGNAAMNIDRNGRRREFEYAFDGELTEERWYSVSDELIHTMSYSYDTARNMILASDADSTYSFTYDVLNQLESVDNAGTPRVPHVVLDYQFDAHGNPESVSDNFGVTVASEYNQRNLLASREWFDASGNDAIDPLSVDFLYNAAGRISDMFRYRGVDDRDVVGQVQRSYDLAGRSDGISFANAVDEALAEYEFGYDALGRLNQDSRAGVSATYGYYLTGQLTSATRFNGNDETFSYDANGNRTLPGYVTGVGNRLQADGTYTYEYDGEGNRIVRTELATGTVTRYEYDHRNRLTRITEQVTGVEEVEIAAYTYDALNRRIIVETTDGVTMTVYDREQAWVDFNGAGAATARYLYDDQIDFLLAIAEPGEQPVFVNTDHLGSVVGYVSYDGALLETITYQAFGDLADGELMGRFGFTGREREAATDLYFYRARYYDPIVGKFANEDPLGFASLDVNLHRYAANTPMSLRDATGLTSLIELSIFGADFSSYSAGLIGGFGSNFFSVTVEFAAEALRLLDAGEAADSSLLNSILKRALATAVEATLILTGQTLARLQFNQPAARGYREGSAIGFYTAVNIIIVQAYP